ncbi:MAG: TIGR00725 family protein [Chloroflexi bacterium]|nr:TIGR00725 family protein [Chloroflexota bacterium]
MRERVFIAVIGGARCSSQVCRLAEEVGAELAKRGAVLVCGGLGGVMEAACRGAKKMGGTTVGILPGGDGKAANPYVDIPIVTRLGYARNALVVQSAQAVIAVDGSYGTLSEIAFALQYGIPVVGLDTWSVAINGQSDQSIFAVGSPQEAVERAMAAAMARQEEEV